MAHPKPKWLVSLEYYPLRGLFRLLGILPWTVGIAISASILRGLWACLPRRRKITDDNLSLAFPKLGPRGRQEIVKNFLSNLSRGITMFAKIPHFGPYDWQDRIRLEGLEHLQDALARGRGVLAFTAHYGCWEAMAAYLPRVVPTSIVVRPLDNPRLESLVSGVRSAGGGMIIPRQRALADGLQALRHNSLLGILIDQNFAPGSLFVDFLGRPAATTPIVSILARRSGCAVLPLHNVWEGNRIRIIFEAPITLSDKTDRALAIAEDTQLMTYIVERWIREDPRQWLWLHHRWKRRPQPGDRVYPPQAVQNELVRS